MRDRVHTAVWLALLALGIALSALQLERDGAETLAPHLGHHHGNEQEPQRIFFWEPSQVKTLMLRDTGGREQNYVRDAAGRLTSTQQSATRPFDTQAYVSLLSRARIDREFPADKETLHTFGLAPALLRIVARDEAGSVLADLSVGERTPDGFGRYVMVPGDANVLIIPNYQFDNAFNAFDPNA